MERRLLLSAPYLIREFDRFQGLFERAGVEVVVADVQERLEEAQLLEYLGGIDGVICGDDHFTLTVLERAAPRLKVISKWGTGIDSIDLVAAQRFGVAVYNTPGAFTDPVADTVMAYILAFARRLPWVDREMKAGRWNKQPAQALAGRTLGVVGVGNIGKAVLRRAKPFGLRLLGNDVVDIDPASLADTGVRMVALDDLMLQSDFLSINCDLNPTSYHLIDADRLARCREGAVLINTARGPVVDQAALIAALQGKSLAGAALDVFEREPLPADSPLRSMENVLLAPHNANSSSDAWERVHRNTIHNLFIGLGLNPPGPEAWGEDEQLPRPRGKTK